MFVGTGSPVGEPEIGLNEVQCECESTTVSGLSGSHGVTFHLFIHSFYQYTYFALHTEYDHMTPRLDAREAPQPGQQP